MAQFYGSMIGNRGEATRMGTKKSGISGHIRGWNIGARASVVHEDGEDFISVSITRGSNGAGQDRRIGTFKLKGNRIIKIR